MGSSVSIVLTVQSPSPALDAETIQAIFPGRFRLESIENSADHHRSSRILVDKDETTAIVVAWSEHRSKQTFVVTGTREIQEAFNRGEFVKPLQMCGVDLGEILLPSGSTIVLVPPALIAQKLGRRALAAYLATEETSPDYDNAGLDREMDIPVDDGNAFENVSLNDDGAVNKDLSLSPSTLPNFPSLQVKLIDQNGTLCSDFPLNSREPVEFESDLFKGKVLFLVRPDNPPVDDPYWNERIFSKKKRRILVQIQGKFKYKPQGVVYAGGEISDPMKLGLVTRGMCSVLLRLVQNFNNNVHYSFGDADQKPHIVVPACNFFERIVVTGPGETPPSIEEPFEESAESIAQRKKSKSLGEWNTTDTYSLSFYSMYIDLPSWQLVRLPLSGDISLKSFWGNSMLRVGMYEKTDDSDKHTPSNKLYAVAVQVKFLGTAGLLPNANPGDDEADFVRWSGQRRPLTWVPDADDVVRRSDSEVFPDLDGDQDSGETYFFDAEEERLEAVDEPITPKQNARRDLLVTIDSVCPAWIEIINGRGGYTKTFAINFDRRTTFRPAQSCEELLQSAPQASKMVTEIFSPRVSSNERTRRTLGLLLTQPIPSEIIQRKLLAFSSDSSKYDETFLRHPKPTVSSEQTREDVLASCFVARAMSDRHWIEEFAVLTEKAVSFRHPDRSKAHFRVSVPSMLKVEKIQEKCSPQVYGYGVPVLAIKTVGRTVYLMFGTKEDLQNWFTILRRLKPEKGEDDDEHPEDMDLYNPADEFLHKSSMWQCKTRRILNCGQFMFHVTPTTVDPLAAVEKALRLVMEASNESFDRFDKRRAFLDVASELKQSSVHSLSDSAKLTFLLNLYHVVIMHAYLVLGPPDSSLKWISYFNNIAYEVDDDIFSLAELEHCIIRARMSFPTQFLSRFVLPKSRYKIALGRGDYRINFALNCGSISNPPTVPVYRVDKLEEQLDRSSRRYLEAVQVVQRGPKDVVVSLPRICQWFSNDFGSQDEALRKLEPYLSEEVRAIVGTCWRPLERRYDLSMLSIRYLPYSFECRSLLLDDKL